MQLSSPGRRAIARQDGAIQYSAAPATKRDDAGYWITRFRG
jgi:hypothetical protein